MSEATVDVSVYEESTGRTTPSRITVMNERRTPVFHASRGNRSNDAVDGAFQCVSDPR
jgi:hypothetical protein